MIKIFGLIILSGVFVVLPRALVPDNDNLPIISFILFWVVVLRRHYKKKKLKKEKVLAENLAAEQELHEQKKAEANREYKAGLYQREQERRERKAEEYGISLSELSAWEKECEQDEKERPGCIEKLRKIPGISKKMAEYIMDTYRNSSGIKGATEEELRSIPKVSKNIAAAIKKAFP